MYPYVKTFKYISPENCNDLARITVLHGGGGGEMQHSNSTELFLVPTSVPLLVNKSPCLWDDAYNRTLEGVAHVAAVGFFFHNRSFPVPFG